MRFRALVRNNLINASLFIVLPDTFKCELLGAIKEPKQRVFRASHVQWNFSILGQWVYPNFKVELTHLGGAFSAFDCGMRQQS